MNNKELYDFFNEYLRPATFPVAIKLSADENLPPKVKSARDAFKYPIAVCQAITAARRLGRTTGFYAEDHACALSHIYFGFKENPDFAKAGTTVYPLYTKSPEAGAKTNAAELHLDVGTFKTMIVAPLHRADFEPDIVIIYGNAAQIVRLIQGELFNEGGTLTSSFMGRCACGSYISYPYKTNKCNVVIPGGGERVFGLTGDDELAFAIPKSKINNVVEGVKGTHDSGVARIPTPFFGITAQPKFPPSYKELEIYCGLRE
ncbi:MAG: DUF169 domain-containing protein [Syntrophomonadaceae bacterium]|jgi:uncharacterized protein (DUF169 family)